MAICYDRLFHLMIDKKISNAQLKEKAGFSANIITRLKRNEYVSIESIEKICRVMECGVDDILEFPPGVWFQMAPLHPQVSPQTAVSLQVLLFRKALSGSFLL